MKPIKVFRIVENSSPFGGEGTHVACFKTRQAAEELKRKSDNAYFSIEECFAIQSGNNFFLLKSDKPIIVLD